MTSVGIMQGRLLPPLDGKLQAFPREEWEKEFPLAAAAGLECIEWIYDSAGEALNPLGSSDGIERIKEISRLHGVAVRSLCADYFVEKPLVKGTEQERSERMRKLMWLVRRCQEVGITRIVLPFVDGSAISPDSELELVEGILHEILPVAESSGVELHLETSMPPDSFRYLLERLPHPLLKVNYDTGNSASLGYRPQDEFLAYGGRIGSVHIKDRLFGGGSVPLGRGNADFRAVFKGLKELGYTGDFILQVARGMPGEELSWAKKNRGFVEGYWLTPQ